MVANQEKNLAALIWSQLKEGVKPWPGELSRELTLSNPQIVRGDSDGLQKDLSWPLCALTLQMEGDLEGRLSFLLRMSDALTLVAWKRGETPPGEETLLPLDEDSQEVLKGLFTPLCAAGEKAFRVRAKKSVKLECLAAQEINKSWELAEDGITVEGWMVSCDASFGSQPSWKLNVWVADTLANVVLPELADVQLDSNDEIARLSAPGAGGGDGAKGKVLVVDDLAVTRTLIRQHLEKDGYSVLEAETGEDALRKATEEQPALVILDLSLPGMNGYEVCRTLKSGGTGAPIPVVVCSASAHKQDIIQAVKSGANDYIVKPFEGQTLLQKVASAMSTAGTVA